MATLLEAALDYGAAGLEVFPCSPIDKTPFVSQYSATADADQITAWWTWRSDALIGCRIPDRYVVIDIDPRHSGDTTWRTLKAELDGIPFTRVSASGRGDGGIHVWFTLPGGVSEKQLSAKGLNVWAEAHSVGEPILKDGDQIGWSSGLDILRHTHRYSILPPSPHPETRKPYRWVEDRGIDVEPASLPELLSKLIIAPPKPPRAERTRTVRQGLSPADWYSEWADWGDLLGEAGWELVSRDGDEDGSLWQHPTATNAYSASIQHHQLFVFSPNTPFPVCGDGGANGQTAFRALAALKHGGDMSAASAEAIALQQAEMESNPIVDVLDLRHQTMNPTRRQTTRCPATSSRRKAPSSRHGSDGTSQPSANCGSVPMGESAGTTVASITVMVTCGSGEPYRSLSARASASIITTKCCRGCGRCSTRSQNARPHGTSTWPTGSSTWIRASYSTTTQRSPPPSASL